MGANMTLLFSAYIITLLTSFSVILFLLGILISPRVPIIIQLVKFGTVGCLNGLLELTIVNWLIALTGIAVGLPFIVFKTTSFLVVLVNAYFWNKFWTFESKSSIVASEFTKFVSVVLVGAAISVGTASLLVNIIGNPSGINEVLWANIAVIIAILVAMIWNFFSQKLIIFK